MSEIEGNPAALGLADRFDIAAGDLEAVTGRLDQAMARAGSWDGIAANAFLACVGRLKVQFGQAASHHRMAAGALRQFGRNFADVLARQPDAPRPPGGASALELTDPYRQALLDGFRDAQGRHDAAIAGLREELRAHARSAAGPLADAAAASRAFRFQPLDVFLNGALIDTPVTADDIAALYDLIRAVESRLGGEVTSEGFDAAADIAPLIDAGDIDGAREALRERFGPCVDDPNFVIGFFSGLGPGRFLNLVDGLGGTSELSALLRGFARFTTEGRSAPSFASGAGIDQLDTILNTDPTLAFGEDFLVAAGSHALEQDVGWRMASVHPNDGDPVYVFEVSPELDRVMSAAARNPTASAHVLLGTTTFTADFPAGVMGSRRPSTKSGPYRTR